MKPAHRTGCSLALVASLVGCTAQPTAATGAAAPAEQSAGGATASMPVAPSAQAASDMPLAPPVVTPGVATTPSPSGRGDVPMASGGLPGSSGGGSSPLATGGGRANYGVRSLNPGFQPDPLDVDVVPGGDLVASTLSIGGDCVGFVSREPDFIVRLTGSSPTLRMYATSGVDTTLLVNDPSGRWHCDDDSFGSHNPLVDLAGAGAGQYDVWVGTFHAGDQATATLHISERGGRP